MYPAAWPSRPTNRNVSGRLAVIAKHLEVSGRPAVTADPSEYIRPPGRYSQHLKVYGCLAVKADPSECMRPPPGRHSQTSGSRVGTSRRRGSGRLGSPGPGSAACAPRWPARRFRPGRRGRVG